MANFIRPLGFIVLGGIAGVGAAYWLAPGNGFRSNRRWGR